jgi:L-threonylcarbamoyladenylate synthase
MLEQGLLVAFPTETVYGLGADASNPAALARIYQAKGRPSDHPLIVHLSPQAELERWATDIPDEARRLAQAFWPGPLTLILRRAPGVPDAVSAGQSTIGLRCPSHPVALALLQAFRQGQGGIAGPSANRFGHVSPTSAQHVRDEFGEHHPLIGCILEGGQSEVGIESTIIDLSRLQSHGPVLLRPGKLTAREIGDVMGRAVTMPDQSAPRVSGTLDAHYAPRTALALVPGDRLEAVLTALAVKRRRVALMHHRPLPALDGVAATVVAATRVQADPVAYAHALYANLRVLDQAAADLIVVETPPTHDGWEAVNDRLRRSAHDSSGVLARMLGKHAG